MLYQLSDILPSGGWSQMAGQMKSDLYVPMTYLCWALAGIFGLVAALRVYSLWNINGRAHLHIDAKVYAWIGAAIFFVLANTFIKLVLRV
mgnify:CR=1 FL=1